MILRRLLGRARHRAFREAVNAWFFRFAYGLSPARRGAFFNTGYAPAPEWTAQYAPFKDEPLQAALCDFVLWEAVQSYLATPPLAILEIGCGQGGGLLVAAKRYPAAKITGVDLDANAARLSQKRLAGLPNARALKANGQALPFADGSFDFVYSIGTASYVGVAFLSEAARALRPGGLISFQVGYASPSFARQAEIVRRNCWAAGLEPLAVIDIIEPVVQAIVADAPRKAAQLARVPWPFRRYAANAAGLPGTPSHASYVNGERVSYVVVAQKRQAELDRMVSGYSERPSESVI